ncbi:hypothetical protein BOX15_Mlig012335g1 [Macrostomum lignano]|uniref:Uncharacterized protein n=1 Tax=Macrostomum lignano TaxID=282301 RepID=A0A267FVT4_9PLAT|nr:hypothetical protein BOX15_Mlig012335g1 [Macrostomum lignano]
MSSFATDQKRLKELEAKLKQEKKRANILHRNSDLASFNIEEIFRNWKRTSLKSNSDFFKSVEAVFHLQEKINLKNKI